MDASRVKMLNEDGSTAVLGGYGIIFGGHDVQGETFTRDTDFMLDLVPDKLLLYDHGVNQKIGTQPLGRVPNASIKMDDMGLWIEAELDKSKAYAAYVLDLVKRGILGLSSGTVGHLMQRAGKTITRWPVVEFSLTTSPAEPKTIGVAQLKSLAGAAPSFKSLAAQATSWNYADVSVLNRVAKQFANLTIGFEVAPVAAGLADIDFDSGSVRLDPVLFGGKSDQLTAVFLKALGHFVMADYVGDSNYSQAGAAAAWGDARHRDLSWKLYELYGNPDLSNLVAKGRD